MTLRSLVHGGNVAWGLIGGFFLATAISAFLLGKTAELRYERDVNRMVFNDNVRVLEHVKAQLGMTADSLQRVLACGPARCSASRVAPMPAPAPC